MPIPFENYLNIRQAFAPTFSHDGRQVFFLTNITGHPQVWRVDANGGWGHQLTFGRDRVSGVFPSPAADCFIFARDAGGNENAQLFLVNGDGSGERRLTHDDGAMHIFGNWSADGRQIMFAANRRRRGSYDLYRQAVEADDATLIWQNETPGYVHPVSFSPDGTRALVSFIHSTMNQDVYEVSLADGAPRLLTPHSGRVRYQQPVYAADGQTVYCLCDLDREFSGVARIALSDLSLHWVATPDAEVELLALSHDGRWLAMGTNVDGATELTVRDLQSGETHIAPGLSTGVISPMDNQPLVFSPDDRKIAFSFSSSTRTLDVWLWDQTAHTLHALTHSSHAGIPLSSFVEPELIHYPTFDGRRIPAWYYRARGDGRKPVIVQVHGGPEGQTQPMLFPIVQYFLNCGYSVLAPNVRGSTGYGKTYVHLDDVEKRMDSVADLAHAAHWLNRQVDVDPGRIAVYGGSYGGFMVLAALTTYPDLWAAGVDIVGISSFVTFLENTSPYRRSHREAEYGSLERDRAFLERISPINHVDKIRSPLMIIHGANDPRVSLGEAEQIAAALRARQVPVEFIVYADEGHGLVKLANKLDAYPKAAGFLAKVFEE